MDKELKTVKVPPQFSDIFLKAEQFVEEYFKDRSEDPTKGTIAISNDRYILVRAASMSVEFFNIIVELYKDKGVEEANRTAKSLLFDVAHAIGKSDARNIQRKMGVTNPIEKLSAGPIHFAYTGWAYVDIFPESNPTPDENYYLIYDHPYSFESDAWIKKGEHTHFPVCIMNAGYSSGWCEESFGVTLVASEIMCKVMGDAHDRFIMAHPSKIKQFINDYMQREMPQVKVESYEIPGFFNRKIQEEELRRKNEELQKINEFMVNRELKMTELKEELEKMRKNGE
jgi:two-component system cell cycle sensor histidine kinase/response regulator CckA